MPPPSEGELAQTGKDSQSLETQIQMLPRRQLRLERCSPQSQELASMSQLTPKTFKRPKRRLSEAFRERNSITKLAWSTASVQKFLKIKLNSEPRRRPVFFIRWILGKDGILRIDGRLKHADLSEAAKHPIVLPKKGHVTSLVIAHYHSLVEHQGRGMTH